MPPVYPVTEKAKETSTDNLVHPGPRCLLDYLLEALFSLDGQGKVLSDEREGRKGQGLRPLWKAAGSSTSRTSVYTLLLHVHTPLHVTSS